MAAKQFKRICPRCKSKEIYLDQSNPLQPAYGLPQEYICQKCNYRGYLVPEIESSKLTKLERMQSKNFLKDNQSQKVDYRYGSFEVKVLGKIFGPLFIIGGILALFKSFFGGLTLILIGALLTFLSFRSTNK